VHPGHTTKSCPDLYGEDYFKGKVYKNYIGERHYRLQLFQRKFSLIKRHIPKGGKLLDVGCATGLFLEVAERIGYEVFGVEISNYAAGRVTETLRSNVFMGELEKARFSDEYFDIVAMWDTLEHLPRPLEDLQEVNRILKTGGVIIIETLNVACLNAKILGPKWPLYAPPHHLFYFSLDTLSKLLLKGGFDIFEVEPIQTYSPIHSHRAIRYFDKSSLIRQLLKPLFADVLLILARK